MSEHGAVVCECDQICCTWCDVHGDTGVDIDAIARDHEVRLFCGLEVEVIVGCPGGRGMIRDHEFLPVADHPDDDECTHRSDGTDATYCGEPKEAHL